MQIDAFGKILKAQGIRSGAGVPCSYFKPLVNYMGADPELDYLPAASEGEAVAIAAGMVTAGLPAFCLMQNSGLGNAVNPLTSLVYVYQMPLVVLVSQRGQPGRPDEPQHELMGQVTKELSELCGLRTHLLEPESFAAELEAAVADQAAASWICRKGTLEGGPAAPPAAIQVQTSAVSGPPARTYRAATTRERLLSSILPLINQRRPATVSTTGKLSRELYELDDREHDQSNRFYMVGSMGGAAGFGLGIARAQPDREVLVLDGDGAVLMKMGTLATAGMLSPRKFHHVVFDNGAYESTGGQITASHGVDLALVALACGYQRADTTDNDRELVELLNEHFETDGPTFLRVLTRVGSRPDLGRPSLKPREGWLRFTGFLRGAPR